MVYVTPQKEINKYFADPSLSQSYLKMLIGGLDSFLAKRTQYKEAEEGIEKEYLTIGSAVDCILTGEEGRFDEIYFISSLTKRPSETEMLIINRVFQTCLAQYGVGDMPLLENVKPFLQESIEFHEYQKNWKMETKIEKALGWGTEYFENLKLAIGKTVLSQEQYEKVMSIVTCLRENPRTMKYFDRNSLSSQKNIDIYYQLPIYFKYRGKACKALLDILVVIKDDDGNVIQVQPADLKTTGQNTIYFLSSVKSLRYDIQGAWYKEAIQSIYPRAEILPFQFIVESTVFVGKPLIYKLSEDLLHIGKFGRQAVTISDIDGLFNNNAAYQPIKVVREIKGFDELLDEYLYYEQNGWEEDKKVTENDGLLTIGWEGIQ